MSVYIDLTKTDKRTKTRSIVYEATCSVCGAVVEGRQSDLQAAISCRHKTDNSPVVPYSRIQNPSVKYVFEGMVKRCYKPKTKGYKWYGAKGVAICNEWLKSPDLFEAWVESELLKVSGSSEWCHGWSIDRVDPAGPYAPDNCRIITIAENSRRAKLKTG